MAVKYWNDCFRIFMYYLSICVLLYHWKKVHNGHWFMYLLISYLLDLMSPQRRVLLILEMDVSRPSKSLLLKLLTFILSVFFHCPHFKECFWHIGASSFMCCAYKCALGDDFGWSWGNPWSSRCEEFQGICRTIVPTAVKVDVQSSFSSKFFVFYLLFSFFWASCRIALVVFGTLN